LLGSFEVVYAFSGIYGRHVNEKAIANGQGLLGFERDLGIAWEHPIQNWTLQAPHIFLAVANRTYFISQFTVSTVFLLWVYARRNEHFERVRNALLAANYVSVVVMFAYPLAPPRALPNEGFVDTLNANAVNLNSRVIELLNNPNSAMPSLHVSYAVVLGITGVLLTRSIPVRAFWAFYPALVTYSIIATANHFVLDVVGGVLALLATPIVDRAARRISAYWSERHSRREAWLQPEREGAS
jgi:membrane-associated phospholipid phosphatase